MNLPNLSLAARYFNQGYVHPVDVMTEPEAAHHHGLLLEYERQHVPMHYRVKPYLIFAPAYQTATHPRLLDAVEQVLGPDILLWDSSYVIKEPHSEGFVSWHQDLTYWGLESDSVDDLVSVWVAITPASRRNGCMQFVRESHRGPRMQHIDTYNEANILHRGQCIEHRFDVDSIDHLEMNAGQCSLHHGWAIHSSNPNTTGSRRVALTFNFVRPSVRQTVGTGESATLVRGVDRFNHFRPEPDCGQNHAPENVTFQMEAERLKREVYDKA